MTTNPNQTTTDEDQMTTYPTTTDLMTMTTDPSVNTLYENKSASVFNTNQSIELLNKAGYAPP